MPDRTYTDPPGMPGDERMTDAEFKVVREFLGLSGDWLAAHLGVSSRTVRHWEQGRYLIPDGVRVEIERLEAETGAFVGGCIERLMDVPDPVVVTYRGDAEYHAAHPEMEIRFPASWHRAVVARVAQEVPALGIHYAPAGATEQATGQTTGQVSGQVSGQLPRRGGAVPPAGARSRAAERGW